METSSTNSAQRKPAPYGHACAGCSKAKCRCVRRGTGVPCERCHRLLQQCLPSTVVRKGLLRRAPGGTARDRLRHKPSDYSNDHGTPQPVPEGGVNPAPAPAPTEERPSTTQSALLNGYHVATNGFPPQSMGVRIACAPPTVLDSQPSSQTISTSPSPSPPLRLDSTEAEEVLKTFKDNHLKSFPFVHFPEGLSGSQLQHDRPTLWLSMRIICCKSSGEKRLLDARFRENLGHRIFVSSERSMDLLLGIIAYLTWIMDRIRDRKFLCVCSGVAASLVFDLRLDRVVAQENPYKETDIGRAYSYPIPQPVSSPERTNEERRAVLACFCICTTISELLESPPMRWTADMEASLQHLSSNPDIWQDRVLVAIAQVSNLLDDVIAASSSRHTDKPVDSQPRVPPTMYTNYLVNKLNVLKSNLSQDVLNEKTIKACLSYAEACINDLPLHCRANPTESNSWVDFRKAEHLYACINACRRHLDNWSNFTIDELCSMSMPIHWYFARCTQIVYRLSLMNDSSWDKGTVCNAIDLLGIMETTAQRFITTAELKLLDVDSSSWFTKAASAMRHAISIWGKALTDANCSHQLNTLSQDGGIVADIAGVQHVTLSDPPLDDWMIDFWTELKE